MALGIALVLWVSTFLHQDPETPPSPTPFAEPHPDSPAQDGFTLSAIALRPQWEVDTREFDAGIFSGRMDFDDVGDFKPSALALEGRFSAGNWLVSATAMVQHGRAVAEAEVRFEQHTFTAGTTLDSTAFYGAIEAFYRIDILGGPAEQTRVSVLAGLNFTRILVELEGGGRDGSESFSALWPVPAFGVEARIRLMERLSLNVLARGTRLRYENSIHPDGGESQDIRILYGRIDAGLEWSLGNVSLSAGYTGLDASVESASAEDTDNADLQASGIYGGITLQF